jgi:DNA-directed RNA polymerase specialized sigma24 family protein
MASLGHRSVMAAVVLGTALTASSADACHDVPAVDAISRYCQACWRNARLPADHWPDATQQVFVRLLERVDVGRWTDVMHEESQERREFLRAIDAVKKRTQRSRKYSALPADYAGREQNETVVDDRRVVDGLSATLLNDKQLRIFDLTFDGWAVPEIANELGTTVERVSDEKYKAIRKIKVNVANV